MKFDLIAGVANIDRIIIQDYFQIYWNRLANSFGEGGG